MGKGDYADYLSYSFYFDTLVWILLQFLYKWDNIWKLITLIQIVLVMALLLLSAQWPFVFKFKGPVVIHERKIKTGNGNLYFYFPYDMFVVAGFC